MRYAAQVRNDIYESVEKTEAHLGCSRNLLVLVLGLSDTPLLIVFVLRMLSKASCCDMALKMDVPKEMP